MRNYDFVDDLLGYIRDKDADSYKKLYGDLMNKFSAKSLERIELLLMDLTYTYMIEYNFTKLKEKFNSYESQVLMYGSTPHKIRFYTNQGIVLNRLNEYEAAIDALKKAFNQCIEPDHNDFIVGIYVNIGVCYNRQYRYHKALKYFLKAYNKSLKMNTVKNVSSIISNIGVTYLNLEDYKNAIYFLRIALKSVVSTPHISKPQIYCNLIIAYSMIKDFNNSDKYIALFEKEKDSFADIHKVAYERVLGINYFEKEDYNAAINQFSKIIEDYSDLQSADEVVRYKLALVRSYVQLKKIDELKLIIDELDKDDNLYILPSARTIFLKAKAQYYEMINDFINASKCYKELSEHAIEKTHLLRLESIEDLTKELSNSENCIKEVAYEEKIDELEAINNELISQKSLLVKSITKLKSEADIRNKLVSVIVHDVRAPIGSIKQLLEMMNTFESAEEKQEIIDDIYDSITSTNKLVNDLVDWAKEILQKEKSCLSQVNCSKIIDETITLFNSLIENKKLKVINQLSQGYSIFAHKAEIQTCFRNIIHNAIKFSPINSVINITEVIEGSKIKYSITDHGIGISSDKINQLFNQASISSLGTNDEKGIGIGLLLINELVTNNNGNLSCKSIEGNGTSFTMSFNYHKCK
jgi:signal transduction histidine kinase